MIIEVAQPNLPTHNERCKAKGKTQEGGARRTAIKRYIEKAQALLPPVCSAFGKSSNANWLEDAAVTVDPGPPSSLCLRHDIISVIAAVRETQSVEFFDNAITIAAQTFQLLLTT